MKISASVRERMFAAVSAGIVGIGPAIAQDNAESASAKPVPKQAPVSVRTADNYQYHQNANVEPQRTELNINIHQLDRIGKDLPPASNGNGPVAPHYFQYNIDLSGNGTESKNITKHDLHSNPSDQNLHFLQKSNKQVILPGCEATNGETSNKSLQTTAPATTFPSIGTVGKNANPTKRKDPCLGCGRG